jgi:hypothetical protein
MSLSVIGAGIGRTGTFSLKAALEQIGYGPCYHMAEVFKHVDAHVPLWNAACDGHPDWDRIFQEYRSAVDFPVAAFYRELAEHYPDAKVILTIRDSSAVWLKSMTATIAPAMRGQVKTSLLPGKRWPSRQSTIDSSAAKWTTRRALSRDTSSTMMRFRR